MRRDSHGVPTIDVGVPSSRKAFIWQLCRRQLGWIGFAMGVALVLVGLGVLSTDALRALVDDGVIEQTEPLGQLAFRLVVLAFGFSIAFFALQQTLARIIYHLEFELRLWLYEHVHAQDPRALDGLATGQMMTRTMTDLSTMAAALLLAPYLIGMSLVLLALFVYLFVQSPVLAPLVLLAFPFNLYLVWRMRWRMWGHSWRVLNRRAQVTTVVDEAVRGIRVVKAFGREEREAEKVKGAASRTYAAVLSRTRLLARFDLLMKAIPTAVNGLLVGVGGWLMLTGAVTLGVLLVFVRLSLFVFDFVMRLDNFVNVWQYARAAAGRIFELIAYLGETAYPSETGGRGLQHEDASALSPEPPPAGAPGDGHPGLHLQDVGVRVDGRDVLNGTRLDLEVAPGELAVVLGGPRSGKTTVASAVAGARQLSHGQVRIDGADPAAMDQVARRPAVRVLSEEPFLFGRTVRENLLMGASSDAERPDEATLRAALWAAGAEDILDGLESGLDERLGDRGLTLSGGQRQRLALARALVQPPRVLVLDDALMAVNPALELEILRRLSQHAPGTAVVCLTRREGPEAVAHHIATLPVPAEGHDLARAPEVNGATASRPEERDEMPLDADLARVVAGLPQESEHPLVGDRDATEDEPPVLRSMLRPVLRPLAGACAILLALGLVSMVPPGITQVALDAAEDGNLRVVVLVAFVVALLGGVAAVLFYAVRIQRKKVEESVLYVLRRRTFARLSRLGIDFYDRELPGEVAARVVYDLDRTSDFMEEGPFELVRSTMMVLLTLAVVFVWSPPVAVVAALFVPLLLLVSGAYIPLASRAYRRVRGRLGEVTTRFQEDFAGRYVIHDFGVEPRARAGFAASAWRFRQSQRWAFVLANGYMATIQLGLELAAAVVLWRAGELVLAGAISAGAMVAFRIYLEIALQPLPNLAQILRQFMETRASLRTLREPFDAPIRPVQRPQARDCPPLRGTVTFDGVRFSYPGTTQRVLDDVTMQVASGETIALVGPTGAGKSSIVKLLQRTYDPNRGAVYVDGIDLRQLDLGSYRRRLGVVPQDAFCFRGTIAENVAYGRPDASPGEIEAAVDAVGARSILLSSQAGVLDAPVEEEGRNLTGGQRQLLALARAWLVRPGILILDEATSALDGRLQAQVLDAVAGLGRTTILVTHRLEVAARADRVAVVDGGRITESGTPDELLGAGGTYAALWAQGTDADLDAIR